MDPIDTRRTTRNVVLFSLVVLAIGWIGHGLDRVLGAEGAETPGLALWISVPVLLSLLLRGAGGDGWKDLGLAPRLAGNLSGYGVALGVFPVLLAAVVAIGVALGPTRVPDPGASLPLLLGSFAGALVPMFVKNILEETAWRGYLTPRLHALGVPDLANHGIVGLVWGLWHLPYFLHFLDRSEMAAYSALGMAAFILLALLAMFAWAIVFGEIRLWTGSLWPAVLMHMTEDALLNPLVMEGHVAISPDWEWLLHPGVGLLATALFGAFGLALHRRRTRAVRAAA